MTDDSDLGQSSDSAYRPWDREEKLGEPPWNHDDPKLIAWEKAHGHDVRLKCYPEFGCQVLPTEDDYNELRAAAQAVLDAFFEHDYPSCSAPMGAACVRLRDLMDRGRNAG